MSMAALVTRHCATCRQEQAFEVPPCQDDHGADCPDLACVVCGTAVTVAVVVDQPVVIRIDVAA